MENQHNRQKSWKVLVFDSSDAFYPSIHDALISEGDARWAIERASGLQDCQQKLTGAPFHAVIIPCELDGRPGIETVREIRKLHLPAAIILYAHEGSEALEAAAVQAGATFLFTKNDFHPALLERVIRFTFDYELKAQSLQEHLERFQLASRAVHGVLYDWSISRDEMYQSEGLERVVGYRPGEEPGGSKDWWPRNIHPDDFGYVQMTLQAAIDGRANAFSYEYRIRHRDGHWVHIWDQGYIVRNQRGEALRVVGMCTDISDRKEAEARLAESENRFRVALASSPITVYTTDLDLRITWMHTPYPDFQPAKVEGLRMDELIPGDVGREVVSIQKKALETGQPQLGEVEASVEGKSTVFAYYIDLYRDPAGNPVGLACAGYDISDRREAEKKIERYARELEQSNRALQEFAYVASHDLQEPLRKIIMFGDQVMKSIVGVTSDETVQHLERMQNAAHRMMNMINGLLELSRISSQGRPFTPVDLNMVLRDVLSDLEMLLRNTGGQVSFDPLEVIEADALQMQQLFQNLLSNAIKYHKPGVPPHISVHGRVNRSRKPFTLTIQVEDNGIGFDERFAGRIFQPFQRLHGRSEYEGTGLGLSICQRIVERHKGAIEVKSTPGGGSIFTVRLPLEQEHAPAGK